MEAKHLMIGDYVYNSNNEICRVCGVSQIFDSNITLDNYSKPNDGTFEMEFEVNPIPCSDEFFRLNDHIFEYSEDHEGYFIKYTSFLISYDDKNNVGDFDIFTSCGYNDYYTYVKTIKYVHEIQHFLFDELSDLNGNKIAIKIC